MLWTCLVALLLKEEELRLRLVAAQANLWVIGTCLTWLLASLTGPCLIYTIVSQWADVMTLVSKEVPACMTLETFLAPEVTLQASLITLGTDRVHLEKASWTHIKTLAIEVEGKWLPWVGEALPALRGVLGCALHAWPVTLWLDGQAFSPDVDQVAF